MPARRRSQLAGLGVAVTVAHVWLADATLPARMGDGAADTRPRRIEVTFVRALAQAEPPRPPALPALRQRPRLAAPARAASSAIAPQDAPLVVPPLVPPLVPLAVPEALPPLAALLPAPVVGALAAAAAASAPPGFEWPPSTRLSYRLTGNYRGPVQGQARVEWLLAGTRYQVFMDVAIGPSFAPLMSRRVSSEGEVTPEGLRPSRYDEETRVVLRDTQRRTIWLDPERVRLPNGTEWPRPAGVQDSASQFVQLTWLFTTQPQLLQVGTRIELPLALPRVVEPWVYDVLAAETLDTPAGAVAALHVKPRREARAGGDLTAEFWVAPSLQYLPVRIVIRQDAETYLDLLIERLPEQAERAR